MKSLSTGLAAVLLSMSATMACSAAANAQSTVPSTTYLPNGAQQTEPWPARHHHPREGTEGERHHRHHNSDASAPPEAPTNPNPQ